jgi:glycosyltransferase involved in cell wall biosynthesis
VIAEVPSMRDKVKVVPNPRPTDRARQENRVVHPVAAMLLYVGRLQPEKGVHGLIEAFRRLPVEREATGSW